MCFVVPGTREPNITVPSLLSSPKKVFLYTYMRGGSTFLGGIFDRNPQAMYWYESAARKGNANAMNNLAIMHGMGEGVQQSNAEAYAWFALAAENGDENAAENRDLTACTWVNTKFDHRAAPGEVFLRGFLASEKAERRMDDSDEELAALAVDHRNPAMGAGSNISRLVTVHLPRLDALWHSRKPSHDASYSWHRVLSRDIACSSDTALGWQGSNAQKR